MLTFNADLHEYRLDGVVIPSVTQVLTSILVGPPDTFAVRVAAERGTIVHATIALDLAGDLDEASVDPQVQPYLDAARLFCRETGFRATETETRAVHEGFQFAGTVDAWHELGWIVDWKTGAEVDPAWRLQTAGYLMLIEPRLRKVGREVRRMAVQLKSDGKYRIDNHKNHSKDRADFQTLLAAVRIKESLK